MKCPDCDSIQPNNAKICSKCGLDIDAWLETNPDYTSQKAPEPEMAFAEPEEERTVLEKKGGESKEEAKEKPIEETQEAKGKFLLAKWHYIGFGAFTIVAVLILAVKYFKTPPPADTAAVVTIAPILPTNPSTPTSTNTTTFTATPVKTPTPKPAVKSHKTVPKKVFEEPAILDDEPKVSSPNPILSPTATQSVSPTPVATENHQPTENVTQVERPASESTSILSGENQVIPTTSSPTETTGESPSPSPTLESSPGATPSVPEENK